MWIEKLARGVIALDTPIGPRYLQPNFYQRALLMWTFRNFLTLPRQVLRPREQRVIDQLMQENRFVALDAQTDWPLIGKIERRFGDPVEVTPSRKPAESSSSAVAERGREAASA